MNDYKHSKQTADDKKEEKLNDKKEEKVDDSQVKNEEKEKPYDHLAGGAWWWMRL